MFFKPSAAYAFEQGGVTYPDTVAGLDFQFNATLTAPPSSLTGTYWRVNAGCNDSPSSMPSRDQQGVYQWGQSLYISFENWSNVSGSTHPWFIYFSWNQSQTNTTLPGISGVDYWARFAYDGYGSVQAWWGLRSGVSRPLVKIYDYSGNSSLVTNHDFIVWLAANSDLLTRHPQGSTPSEPDWVSPPVEVVNYSFAFTNPSTNPTCYYFIELQDGSSWLNKGGGNLAPGATAAYTADVSGTYRIRFTYGTSGEDIVSVGYLTVPAGASYPVLQSYQEGYTANARYYVHAVYANPQPVSVKIQTWVNGAWVDDGNLRYDSSQGMWFWNDYIREGSHQLVATSQAGLVTYTSLSVSQPSDTPNFNVFGDMMEYVQNFFDFMGEVWSWLPPELSAFLITAIMAMIILGIVQLVKP